VHSRKNGYATLRDLAAHRGGRAKQAFLTNANSRIARGPSVFAASNSRSQRTVSERRGRARR